MSNSSADKPVAVIGIGNYLRGDDGAGIHAVDKLRSRPLPEEVDIIDGATAGPGLQFYLEGREKVIFIDAGCFGGRPGEWARFNLNTLLTHKTPDLFTTHGFDLVAFLQNPPPGVKLPGTLVIYCIEPVSMEPSTGLTPAVDRGLDRLVEAVRDELAAGAKRN